MEIKIKINDNSIYYSFNKQNNYYKTVGFRKINGKLKLKFNCLTFKKIERKGGQENERK